MNDLDMTLIELKECQHYPGTTFEAKIFFLWAPLDTIELFRDCSTDIEEQIKGELDEAVWEYIQEALEYGKLAD